ncbi:MAG: 30S ribosomal protein S5 [Candidatus Omnitrophota bacterium]
MQNKEEKPAVTPGETPSDAGRENKNRPEERPSRGGGGFSKKSDKEFPEHVVKINRVSKVVKGGRNFSFSALVVTGDGKGRVGVGFGKSNEVVESIKKGVVKAKKNLVLINLKGDTIPHEVMGKYKASRVLLKPASPGTGVIAGGPVRALCEAVGIKNILTKSLGSRNAINVIKAALCGLQQLQFKRKGCNTEDTEL